MKHTKLWAIICCCALLLAVSFNFSAYASEDTVYHWYCKRQADHKQPIADATLQWIEQYNGYYIDHMHGDTCEDKVLYLTFDVGYENGNVKKILDTLQAEQVSGAFFILGHVIQSHPELVKRMVAEGHTVCNHTTHHPNMTTIDRFEDFQQELQGVELQYKELVGEAMAPYFRPPEGKFDQRSMGYAQKMGYKTIFWSFAYADWDNQSQPSPEAAKIKILENLHNGSILLLHPTSETNALILQDIIQKCKSEGYRFGTLDELTKTAS